jgi:hypothetical protein
MRLLPALHGDSGLDLLFIQTRVYFSVYCSSSVHDLFLNLLLLH